MFKNHATLQSHSCYRVHHTSVSKFPVAVWLYSKKMLFRSQRQWEGKSYVKDFLIVSTYESLPSNRKCRQQERIFYKFHGQFLTLCHEAQTVLFSDNRKASCDNYSDFVPSWATFSAPYPTTPLISIITVV